MQERRKTNRQTTIEKVEKELSKFATKEELQTAVNNRHKDTDKIFDIINFDGGLVYKCDLEELKKQNKIAFEKIDKSMSEFHKKMDLIYPKVADDIKIADAYNTLAGVMEGRIKSGGFWIRVILGVGFVVGVLVLLVDYAKKLIIK
jgi:hypothetical protein